MTARRDHAIAVRRMLTLMAIVLCSFAITVDADAAPEGRRCKSEPTESENIAYGDLITCSIDTVGDSEIFRFNAKIGEKISIRATRTNIFLDPCIQLRGPDGVVLDSSCGGNAAALDLDLKQAGQHTIVVSDSGNNDTGGYNLSLERISPVAPFATAIKHGQTLTGQSIDPQGDRDLFVFNGTPGDRIVVRAARGSIFLDPCVTLFGPDGVSIANACGGSAGEIEVALLQGGIHTVLVEDSGHNDTGPYTLTLQCIVGACTGPGSAGMITATADTGGRPIPVNVFICESNPASGACLSPPAPSVTRVINPNETPTFVIVASASGPVANDPANNRIFVRFTEQVTCGPSNTITRGSTSVAVRTP